MTRAVVLVLVFLVLTSGARAHDPGLSTLELRLDQDDLVVREIFIAPELESEGGPREWKRISAGALEVRLNDQIVNPAGIQAKVGEEGEARFDLIFGRLGARQLSLRSLLVPKLGRGHRQYVTLVDDQGVLLQKKLLSATDIEFEATLPAVAGVVAPVTPEPTLAPVPAPTPVKTPSSFRIFLRLGVEHILTGYDHLLFLFGLLVVGTTFWSATKIITSFTVAHSISLALATFNIVSLPPRIVEPLIAATIVYVGLENLWHHDLRYRWVLTFFFGLVHGLGFASVLRELGVGSGTGGVTVPLVAFNLGVEVGQIAVAAVVLPIIWRLSRLPNYKTRYVPAFSLVVTALGAFWLLQRIIAR